MSDTVYDDVVVSESGYDMGENNTYNNLVVNNDAVLGNYVFNTVVGLTIEDEFTFVQFEAGEVSNVELNGGKFEVAGTTKVTNIVVDGSEYSQEVGVTGDNNSETGFSSTQLVVYAADAVIENLTLQNGGSAFIYNGATLYGATIEDGGVLYLTNWNLDADTVAYVYGITTDDVTGAAITVNAGGTLWLGSGSVISGTISTYTDSNIIWDASAGDVTIDYIILRGTNIEITEGLIINSVLQGNDQTVDGGYVGTWTNNYGAFTMTSGTVESYVQNTANSAAVVTISGGTVGSLDLSTNGAINYIYGGNVDNITLGGGYLRIWTDAEDSVSNLVINGEGNLWLGDYDNGVTDAKITNLTLNAGVARIDGIVDTMTMNGGYISLYGGTITDLTTTAGAIYNYGGSSHPGTITGFDVNDTTTSTPYVTWTDGSFTNSSVSGASQEFNNVTFNDTTISATDSVINDAVITNGTMTGSTGTTWNNLTLNARTDEDVAYYYFADGSIINGLYSEYAVSLGAGTTATDITMNAGAIIGYGEGTTVTGMTLQGSGWAQFMTGSVTDLTLTGTTKFEAWYSTELYDVVVDADGVDVEMGTTKVGADLVLLYSASAENVTLTNGGSAHVYESASISNVTATDGGVLYMTNWTMDAGSTGTAEDVYITSTGGFYYNLGAGEIDGLTIEAGANVVMNISTDTDISGTYISGIDGIGDIKFDNLTWVSIVFENSTLYGNYGGTGYTNALDYDELYVFEGGSLYGVELNTSYVESGYNIASDGTVTTFSMGGENESGGYHAEGVYFLNGLAILGSGAANSSNDGIGKYHSSNGLTFDASTFVVGNMTVSTDLTFVNGSSLQTYSNSEIYLTNLDESEDSIYRTGSIVDGVVSNIIFENGGFVYLYAADLNYTGSAAGHAQDIMLVGKTDAAIGNYGTANMTMFGGYSYLHMQAGTTADGVYVSEYCTIYSTVGNITATNVTLETYGNLYLTAVTLDTAISGTKNGVDFSIADGVITNLTMDSSNAYIGTSLGIAYENLTFTAGYLNIVGDTTFTGTTVIGAEFYSFADDATVTYSGDVTFTGLETTTLTDANITADLTDLTIVGGTISVLLGSTYDLATNVTLTDVTGGNFQARLGEGSSLVIDNSTFILEPTWYNYSCDITVTNGSSVNWWGDGISDGYTLSLSVGSAVAVNTAVTFDNIVIEDSSTLTVNSAITTGSITVNSTSGYGVLGYAGFSFADMAINTGKVILEAGSYTGDITVVGDGVTSTYFALYGDLAEGTIEVTGAGTAYIGFYGGSAGTTAEAVVVSTGVADTGTVNLRNGSVGGLDIDGGSIGYEAGFSITGAVSLSNTNINGLSLSGSATTSMDLTAVSSFTIGHNVTANISIDASNSYDVSVGANLSIADGMTITVGSLTAVDFTGIEDYSTVSVTGLDQVVGTVSISTITTGTNDSCTITLCDADYLNWADGIVVDGVTITEANTTVTSNYYQYTITVDEDTNVATFTKSTDYNVWTGEVVIDNADSSIAFDGSDVFVDLISLTVNGGEFSLEYADTFTGDIYLNSVTGWIKTTMGADTTLTLDNCVMTFEPRWYTWQGDVNVVNGTSLYWWGDSMASGTTLTIDNATVYLRTSANFGDIVVDNGGYLNASYGDYLKADSLTVQGNGQAYITGCTVGEIVLNDGWVQFDGVANTHTANVTVDAAEGDYTYVQVIGTLAGNLDVAGYGYGFVGSYDWGAGYVTGVASISSGVAGVGYLTLRNGSVAGLSVDGGIVTYEQYNAETGKGMVITGDVSLANTIINGSDLSGEATTSMDLTSVDSFTIGNNVTTNISIDASNSYDVSVGAFLSVADGMTITVGSITAFNFTGLTDWFTASVTGLESVEGTISVGTITTGSAEACISLGSADYLNWADGITINATATITEANAAVVVGYYTYMIAVDADNNATLTVYRNSSADRVTAVWPEGWDGPALMVPVTAEDVETYAVDGVLYIQEAGPSDQVRFFMTVPGVGNCNVAAIDSACDDLTVMMGQYKTFTWGARAATYASVTDVQNLTIFGGGSCIGMTLSDSSNIYVYGEDTTTTAVFGAGLRDFTAAEGSTYYQVTEANIAIEDGTHALVAGGGYGADVLADVNIDATGAEFTGLVSGAGMGNVGGDVNITMTSVSGSANIFGGASCSTTAYLFGDAALAESVTVAGSVNMVLADSSITGMVFGGGSASGAGIASTVAGDVNISFSNSIQENNVVYTGSYTSAWIVGGGQAVNGATAEVAGSVNITVTDSTVGNIVAGGQATGSDSYSVVASTNVTIAGSTVTSNVFGGGYTDGVATSVVTGDVSITIDATTDTSIFGDIYAGGSGTTSTVNGDAVVTFTGSADALSFTGSVYGDGNYAAVSGSTTISFASFTGSFAATVVEFDTLSFSADTAMSFETTVSVTCVSFDLSDRADTSVAFVDATNVAFENIELAGIADVSEDSVFTLATSVSDSLVEDAMFSIMDDDSIEIGTFTFGEELVVEGVGSYLASLTDGVLTIEFKKELDDTEAGLLA